MVEYEQLSSIYDLAREIEGSYFIKEKYIKGAFVECGVWKGGCAGIMAYVANQFSGRQTWLFDSFEGLPEATDKDGIRASYYTGRCKADYQDVAELLYNVLKIDPKTVNIKIGLFQNTLPKAKTEIGDIAILRLDGDWYESTKCCLENLYDNVVEGGYVVLDDYNHWQGAKLALDEFLAERGLTAKLIKVDSAGIYFKK